MSGKIDPNDIDLGRHILLFQKSPVLQFSFIPPFTNIHYPPSDWRTRRRLVWSFSFLFRSPLLNSFYSLTLARMPRLNLILVPAAL